LSLINCGIKKFPEGLENLSNLNAILLNDNLIKELPHPKLIKQSLKNLSLIDLRRNPIYEENFEILPKWKNQFSEYGITLYFD